MLKESKQGFLNYQKLSKEEMEQRGILGRLVGICADFINPTRNGRKYSEELWEKVFDSDIMKEKIANRVLYGELAHPLDREETDIEKIAVCMAEQPRKGDDGKLYAVFDILNTPNGKILKTLCDYGSTLGVSSRGSGDLYTDMDGQEAVDPSSYNCEAFDIVLVPAVKAARLKYVNESLEKTRYNKTLRQKLTEELDSASEEDKAIMQDTLKGLDIDLEAKPKLEHALREDEEVNAFMDIMASNDELQEEPCVGCFWYDHEKQEVFGVRSTLAQDVPYLSNNIFDGKAKTGRALHKNIWAKECKRHKDARFAGDYTQVPRGRVFEVDGKGFVIMVGNWINDCPEAKDEIICEFNLPADTEFKQDSHWDLGHGWSDEEYLENLTEEPEEGEEEPAADEFAINTVEDSIAFLGDLDTKIDLLYNFIDTNKESLISEEELINKLDSVINKFTAALDLINPEQEEDVIDMETEEEVVDDMSDEVTAELQESLLKIKELEKDNLALQEKLSVSNAKDTQIEEEITKYKNAMISLSESAKRAKDLNNKVEQLTESLNKKDKLLVSNKAKLDELLEIKTKSNKQLGEANEKISSLETELTSLSEQLKNANKNLTTYKEKTVKLSSALKESKDLYLKTKAESYGLTVDDVKSQLTESYTIKDVNSVCEQLSDTKRNLSALPFSHKGRVTITEAKTSGDYITRNLVNTDDEISDTLLNLIN